jgi:predicted secreted protein
VEAAPPRHVRPLSLGEILDVAIKIYLRHAFTFFGVVLVVVAPVQVVASFIEVSAASGDEELQFTETGLVAGGDDLWVSLTAFGAITILSVVAGTLVTAACFNGVADAYLGERPRARASLGFAARRLHSVLWLTILSAVVTGVLFLLCIVPGIWAVAAFAVAMPALLTEGTKGRKALGRSRNLVQGRWWSTFGIVVLGYVLGGIITVVLTGLLTALSLADPTNDVVAFVASAGSGILASMLTTPFIAAFITVLYFDLRVRKEGFDLQLLAERLGRRLGEQALAPAAPVEEPDPSEKPPFWPPPPGWEPSSRRDPE